MNSWALCQLNQQFLPKQKKRKVRKIFTSSLRTEKQVADIIFIHSVLEYEALYLENLPNVEMYERSYMHRDIITHVVSTR